jgi:hypothetical protein
MAGLPAIKVELDDATNSGTWPHDITAYVDIKNSSIRTERGRQDEFKEIEAGDISLRLNNNDGRFTLGAVTYGIVKDKRIRFTETIGATVSRRFVGYVDDWPVRWEDPVGKQAYVTVSAVDRMARLARRDAPVSLIDGEISLDKPIALYAFLEEEASLTAGDTSGGQSPPLTITGTGDPAALGATTGDRANDLSAVEMTAGGQWLEVDGLEVTPPWTVSLFFTATTDSALLYIAPPTNGATGIGATTYIQIRIDGGILTGERFAVGGSLSTFDSGVFVADDKLHHVAFTMSATGAANLYVDGILTAGAGTGPVIGFRYLRIGPWTGTGARLAIFKTALTGSRISQHATAGLRPESDRSDQRIARYAAYAGIAPADQTLDVGMLKSTAVQSAPKLLPAMQEVATSEGGALFVNGSGKLVFQSRNSRPLAVPAAVTLALVAGDYEHDNIAVPADGQYLFNDVTGSRPDGAVQRAKNDASLAKYEQYPGSLNLAVTTDAEVLDRASWQANAYAEPIPRLSSVTLDLLTQPAAFQAAALGIEIGSKITLSGLPAQGPFTSAALFVEGLVETVGRDVWTLTLNTVAAELYRAWILEDLVYGVLEVTTRPYF